MYSFPEVTAHIIFDCTIPPVVFARTKSVTVHRILDVTAPDFLCGRSGFSLQVILLSVFISSHDIPKNISVASALFPEAIK